VTHDETQINFESPDLVGLSRYVLKSKISAELWYWTWHTSSSQTFSSLAPVTVKLFFHGVKEIIRVQVLIVFHAEIQTTTTKYING